MSNGYANVQFSPWPSPHAVASDPITMHYSRIALMIFGRLPLTDPISYL